GGGMNVTPHASSTASQRIFFWEVTGFSSWISTVLFFLSTVAYNFLRLTVIPSISYFPSSPFFMACSKAEAACFLISLGASAVSSEANTSTGKKGVTNNDRTKIKLSHFLLM